ncbi:MAG: DUF4290 domain-containing protein [Flavobacteriales bacterium]|nr:DUF4290 domain-containing protein [Flavobacteriales bacterium]
MDYNTEREQLIIPEYGRHVQKMVAHATSIADRKEREKCVNAIITYMGQMNPHLRDIPDYKHKLWDHLFIMSDFKLDVDSPYEKPSPEKLSEKPDVLKYPKSEFSFSYYGKHIETMIETAINMKDEKEKTTLTGMIANHMKKCYIAWSKSSVDDKTILKHLERLSKGKLILDKDFVLIVDAKATSKKANGHNSRNKKNNYKSKKKRY